MLAARLQAPYMRNLVPMGIVQTLYLTYGLHCQQLLHLQRGMHRLYYQNGGLAMRRGRDVVAVPARLDVGALVRATHSLFVIEVGFRHLKIDDDMLQAVHLTLASLRNGVGVVMDVVEVS